MLELDCWECAGQLFDLGVVLVPSVYLFNSTAEVYMHYMQCHVRSCCLFLHLDQCIVRLRQLLYSDCPLSWQGEGICSGSNLWLSCSSALHPWLKKTILTVKSTLLSMYLFFMWTAASLMVFSNQPAKSVNFSSSHHCSLSSGYRGFL